MLHSLRNKIISTIIIISFSCLFFTNALAQKAEKRTVANIQVIGLNNPEAEDRVKLNSGLFAGKEVTGEDFADAIKRIWRMGTFSNVQITTDAPDNEALNIMIRVAENPRIDFLRFEGNDEVKNDKLAEIVNFYRGQVVNHNRIRVARKRVIDHYIEKGYLLAQVTVDTVEATVPDRLALAFNIDEGEKVKIKKIFFEGNDSFSDGKLRKQFEKTKQDGIFTGGDFNRGEYEEDKKKIPEFYKNNGFRDAVVIGDSIYYDERKKDMFIVVKVNEGTQYYCRNVEFEGNKILQSEFLKSIMDISKGDVYNYEKIQKGIEEIQGILSDRGYLLANINYPEKPVGQDSVDITVYIQEGNPVSVNMINIQGNTKTKEKVIRRELKIKPGERFSREKIMRSLRDVYQLNFFGNVEPEIGRQIVDDKVDVTFLVEEKSTDTANMSAGYSERDGMIGSLGLSMNNLFGNGQQLSIDWQFGKIYRALQLGFTEPYLFDTRTLAGFSIFDLKRGGRYYGYDQESRGITLRLGRKLTWPDNFFIGNWYFEYSKNRYYNIQSLYYYIGRANTTKVSVTQVISRDSRRFNPEFYEGGMSVSYATQYSGGFLGGSEHFIKNTLKTENYYKLIWKFVLFQGTEFGWIKSLTDDEYVSPQDAFYMGGSALALGTSLRGYEERSVGPTTKDGYPVGAKTMAKFSNEVRFQFSSSPTIYGLLFAEAGNAWVNANYVDPFDLRKSVGVGIRMFLPMVGMLGIDFGYGFDNYDEYGNKIGKWKPHFQFGKSF